MGVGKRGRDGSASEAGRRACVQKVNNWMDVEIDGIQKEVDKLEADSNMVAIDGESRNPLQCRLKTHLHDDCSCTRESSCELHRLDVIDDEDLAVVVKAADPFYGDEAFEEDVDDDILFEGDEKSVSEGACSAFDVGDSGSEVDSDMYAPAQWSNF